MLSTFSTRAVVLSKFLVSLAKCCGAGTAWSSVATIWDSCAPKVSSIWSTESWSEVGAILARCFAGFLTRRICCSALEVSGAVGSPAPWMPSLVASSSPRGATVLWLCFGFFLWCWLWYPEFGHLAVLLGLAQVPPLPPLPLGACRSYPQNVCSNPKRLNSVGSGMR